MSDSAKPHTRTPKGIIVVDYSALADLLAPSTQAIIPDEQKMDDNQPRHVDWLVALAQKGIEIIIPEEIAFAAGNVFIDGEDVSVYGNNRRNDELRKEANIFLKAVGRGLYPNIHIMPVAEDARSSNAKTMIRMRKLHLGEVVASENEPKESVLNYSKQFMMRPLNNEIIPDTLRALPKDVPLFLLHGKLESADYMLKMSGGDPRINKLNSKGMLLAIKKSGVLKELGHNPYTHIEHIMKDIKRGKIAMGLSVGEQFGHFAQDRSSLNGDYNDHPFAAFLTGIMHEQGHAEQPTDWQARTQASKIPGTGITGV